MKNCLLLFFISLSISLTCQTTREFYPSKTNKFTDNTSKLVLNPKSALYFINRQVDDFKDARQIEIINIKDPEVLEQLAKRVLLLQDLEELTFDNCDLFFLTYEFSALNKLKSLKVLNTSSYNPNELICALKSIPALTRLTLCLEEPFCIPDSLYLLKGLKDLDVINPDPRANKLKTHQIVMSYSTGINTFHKVEINQSGFSEPLVAEVEISPAPSEPFSFSFSNAVINPPVKNMDINDRIYNIDTKTDNTIDYTSGTTLYIPRSAFMTKDGKEYNGPVKLFYREFRNPIDQLLSGIPMTNTAHGDTNIFISAGMYELWAYNDQNEKLQLKPGKKITLDFVPTTDTGTYNFYSLDTSSGQWASSAQSVNLTRSFTPLNGPSRAVSAFLDWRRKLNKISPDRTPFEDRFSNTDYHGIVNKMNFYYYKDSTKFSITDARYYKGHTHRIRSKYKVHGVRLTKKGELLFNCSMNRYNYDFGFGQNLRSLEGKQLQYAGTISKDEFKKMFCKKLVTDVRLNDNGSGLVLRMKTPKGIIELPFNIVEYDAEKKEWKSLSKMEHIIARHFNLRVKSMAKTYDKKNVKDQNGEWYDIIRKPDPEYANLLAYQRVKRELNTAEKIMTYEAFVKMADSTEKNLNRWDPVYASRFNQTMDTMVASTNKILINSNLGFNNIDCYLHKGLVMDLYVQYVAPGSKEKINTKLTTTIVKGINTSISNYNWNEGTGLVSRFIKGKKFILLRLDEEGYMQIDRFDERLKHSSAVDLPLTNKIFIRGKSSAEIAKLMDL